ncbi:ABC transporter ATP-binding protein [Lactobacillus paraplantarum] [Lactiplantibacillus mudanjiangensis]|uniref:ABC transporter ATP-binding protein n=1 Tax=Lactiplantibacillus mudanjiangensis TaxID=1296538 RepID=UPI001014CD5C|nr:ATP-binding cassette domain-containing protein [Lactiplantibacillus mudanjiangensis]VDG33140.1 ABC transporter ATP-binding protein [Lactobacillus paraplantarum] [Lactiplantibacillus mudanjiangensis]
MSLIELTHVSKKVKGQVLLEDVNLTISSGEIAVFEGINGSGKTLVLKAILGLIRTSGQIKINDQQLKAGDAFPIQAGIMIENPSVLEEFTGKRNLELLAKLLPSVDNAQIEQLLTQFELPIDGHKCVKKFSLGMRQKLGIAQAMLGNSELIILDEPTNALDAESIDRLIAYIHELNKQGTTFLIASHDREFVTKVANRQFLVKAGHVYEN